MLTCDEYLTPGSLDEVFDMMASNRGRYRIMRARPTLCLGRAKESEPSNEIQSPGIYGAASLLRLNKGATMHRIILTTISLLVLATTKVDFNPRRFVR